MRWTNALALSVFLYAVHGYDLAANLETPLRFSNPSSGTSVEGKAACVSGKIAVTASASNTKLLLKSPASQPELTQTTVDMAQAGSDYMQRVTSGGPNPVSGTFQIYSQLCVPNNDTAASKVQTLQFLSHGGTLDHTYWNFAPGYSYVDAAAAAGYATFIYDRLGTGLSDHPDPNQVVQAALQVEIAHALIQGLRKVRVQGKGVQKVVGVGHSAGSALTLGVVGKYLRDFDGLVFTGISASVEGVAIAQISFNLLPAPLDPSGRFRGLDNGYLTQGNVAQDFQFPFYRYPEYDLRKLLTFGSVVRPQPGFTGPVDVVLGQYDNVFCSGNCSYPADQAQAFVTALFPASLHKGTYLQPRAGHLIAQHYTANQGFAHSLKFLKDSGL
ncbi:MAG: hypothetical protein LQ342_008187 [Letrouitia transgressa]|nr:MAG: hypothetical protein LQ342_008187 [Letrouitia transgressa]